MATKAPKVQRYAVVNADGETVNLILWDGVSEYTLLEGCSLVLENKAAPFEPTLEE